MDRKFSTALWNAFGTSDPKEIVGQLLILLQAQGVDTFHRASIDRPSIEGGKYVIITSVTPANSLRGFDYTFRKATDDEVRAAITKR